MEIHQDQSRFKVIATGRQFGKSTYGNNELLKYAWEHPGSTLWYISPTYDSAKVMFRRLLRQLGTVTEIFEDNKSDLMIELSNGSRIFYKSGEVLENLRTETLHGAVIDEVRNQHQDLWPMIIRPMLATTKGWAIFISTPNGYDHFYDLANFAKTDTTGRWKFFTAPSTSNPLITLAELEDAKRTMSEAQYAQEYLAEFRDLTAGKVYVSAGLHNYLQANPFTTTGELHPMLGIIVAMDFNVGHMNWTLGQKKGNQFYWFDEICIQNTHTQQQAEVLAEKISAMNHKPGVILVGDASGSANKTSAAGQTDYDLICQTLNRYNIPWVNMTPESNPKIRDRVNTVNAVLRDATGAVNMWIHPVRCPVAKRDFERVIWKLSSNSDRIVEDQTKDPSLTHSSSGIGYAVCALSPLTYESGIPTTRIVIR